MQNQFYHKEPHLVNAETHMSNILKNETKDIESSCVIKQYQQQGVCNASQTCPVTHSLGHLTQGSYTNVIFT